VYFTVLATLVPVLAAGQTPPPPPPTPPLPPVPAPAPAPVQAPVPPPAPRILGLPSDVLLTDALREAALLRVDADQLREMARVQAEVARIQEQIQHDARWDTRYLFDAHWDAQSPFSGVNVQNQGDSYRAGLTALDRGQYLDAITRFDRVITQKGTSADGALYWKAFSQYKLGKTDEAVATIAQLRRDHAQSSYLKDAQVLETDARRQAGQPVDVATSTANDEILLYAITGMMNSDPVRAVPLLSDLLGRTNSFRVKKHGLYTLALSDLPAAHQILLSYAKGGGNPDLQREAIKNLATGRNKQTTSVELLEIYRTTTDPSIKMAIINALGASRNAPALVSLVSGGDAVNLRSGAVSNLTNLLTPQELWALFQREENRDLRLQMVGVFGSMGAVDQLGQVAKTDRDPAVRQRAIRGLGSQKAERTGQVLVDIYTPELDRESKNAVISGLSSQSNAEGLVAIARKETGVEMRASIVSKLASLAPKSKVAADFLAEIIGKR
jgi:HEAT repeat protein